jgi:hypothetical protein
MKDDTVFWKMRNGKLISIDDMDINHLRNTLKTKIMKEALKWWDSLPDEMKANFPTPKSNEDILDYYEDPAGNMQLEYGML